MTNSTTTETVDTTEVADASISEAISAAPSAQYFVPSDPMDDLQCDSCQ